LRSDGSLWGWGKNSSGQLGNGKRTDQPVPVKIGAQQRWIQLAIGAYFTIGLQVDGTLWAWGDNEKGQLGNGTFKDTAVPVQIGQDKDWTSIAAGSAHGIALKADSSLWAWGNNKEGQLGILEEKQGMYTRQVNLPTKIGQDNDWTVLAAGFSQTVALKAAGSIWAWGWINAGRVDGYGEYTPFRIGVVH